MSHSRPDGHRARAAGAVDRLLTPRLTLSPLQTGDAAELHELWTTPGVRRFLWDDEVIPARQTAGVLETSSALFAERGLGLWGARLCDASSRLSLAGFVGYWFFRDPPELELLYGVAEPLWGRGLATELANAMVRYAWDRLSLPAIHASTDVANVASTRVLEKAGFKHTHRAVVAGLDTVFYELARPRATDVRD
jgi:ribosomal-protein-alanine N-acetyltransferase